VYEYDGGIGQICAKFYFLNFDQLQLTEANSLVEAMVTVTVSMHM